MGPDAETPAGLVLAGGRSRRFGRDKARHRIEGQPMIRRVYDVVAATCQPVLVSVAAPGDSFADVLPTGVRYVPDAAPNAGPLAGLTAGLEAAPTEWVLAAACDLPFLTAEALRSLLDAPLPDADVVIAAPPDAPPQPLCACYRRAAALPVARRHFAAGRLALRDLVAVLNTHLVEIDAAALRNVNRPADL